MHHVYVAGSSREIPRVREAVRLLDAAGLIAIAHWLDAVEKFGSQGDALTDQQRATCAASDLESIDHADAVLVLWPETPSVGAYIELGYALGRARHDREDPFDPVVLIVGGDSIWHSHVRVHADWTSPRGETFATVEDAIEWMRHEMHVCGEWPDAETVARMNAEHEAQEAGE